MAARLGVVGLGGLGSATAYWAARRGVHVVGFEQFELGHVRGASHDRSRIIRRSYHTPRYVRLAADAYAAWRAVEEALDEPIVTVTGGVDLFPTGAAIDIGTYTSSLAAEAVPFEVVDGAEVQRRWPAFAGGTRIGDDVTAIVSPDTGIVPAARATAALQQLAVAHGADLRDRMPVLAVEPGADGVDVVTDDGRTRVDAVVLAADAWTERLVAPLGVELPLCVQLAQVTYFAVADPTPFRPGAFPVWIWMDDPSYYGFPEFGLAGTVKASEDCGGPPADPDQRGFEPEEAAERRLTSFVRELFGDLVGPARQTSTCLYTLTADRDFVLDRVADHPNVVVALGAAHGFKFASWFGRTASALALDPSLAVDDGFALDRSGLGAPVDPAAWLV